MAVVSYSINVLNYDNCKLKYDPKKLKELLHAWRNFNSTSWVCDKCEKNLTFKNNFKKCCNSLYFTPAEPYIVQSIAVLTPGYSFLPKALKKAMIKENIPIYQDFIIFPDPLYWQVSATLVYDRVINYVLGLPPSKRKHNFDLQKNPSFYYKQMQTAFLYHGSYSQRSEGKNTYFRKIALAKRCEFTARAMIIPAPFLKANEIIIPHSMEQELKVKNKWLIINRMPSLLPENFVALRVIDHWKHDCFGIPLEIVQQIGADFDGDEVNAYIVKSLQAQAECEVILNSENNISSFTMGLKLTPCHDMLITYYLKYREINFLPYKHLNLEKTFKVIFDLYGSKECFSCFDKMRKYYLNATQNDFLFTLSFSEILELKKLATSLEEFIDKLKNMPDNCLLTQIRSGAKGSFIHLYQLVGAVGLQCTDYTTLLVDPYIKSSFFDGLTPMEMVIHAQAGFEALINTSEVWRPGYNFFKLSNNLQDLEINHLGQVVDKNHIISDDSVEMMYYEDLLSKESFQELITKHLLGNCL